MKILQISPMTLAIDAQRGCVTSVTVGAQTLLAEESALFRIGIRLPDSTLLTATSAEGRLCGQTQQEDGVRPQPSQYDQIVT